MSKLSLKAMRNAAALINTLNDQTRLELLELLWDGEMTVSEVMARIKRLQSPTSAHLVALYEQDLLFRRKHGKHNFYCTNREKVKRIGRLITKFV